MGGGAGDACPTQRRRAGTILPPAAHARVHMTSRFAQQVRSAASLEHLHAAAPLLLMGAWAASLQGVELRAMNDLGLASVLPIPVFLVLFALTASFVASLGRYDGRGLVPFVHVVVLTLLLFGLAPFLEEAPRFSSTYRHIGIIDYLDRNGTVDPEIDAYFSWPGFFAFGALLERVTGLDGLGPMAKWAATFFNLLFLAPLLAILRWATTDHRVVWLGAWLFVSLNWVGQDYLSPQAVAYASWLTMLAVLLTRFTPPPGALADGPLRQSLRQAVASVRAGWRAPVRSIGSVAGLRPIIAGGLLGLVVVIGTAIVIGHQLTPAPMLLTVAGLAVTAGLVTRRLPVLLIVIFVAWVTYMTTVFLAGHLDLLVNPLGDVRQNLSSGVSSRVKGSPQHQVIVRLRLLTSLVVWLLALAGGWRRLRARRFDVAMATIALAPFLLPIVQPYGGEINLRVFLFTLPAVVFFIATLAFPSPATPTRGRTTLGVGLVGCLLLVAFQFTRYGNEHQDYFTPGDQATVAALYRLAPDGSVIISGNDNVPFRYENYADHRYNQLDFLQTWDAGDPTPELLLADLHRLYPRTPFYVIITRSSEIYAALFLGEPGVLEDLDDLLTRTPEAEELYRNDDGVVFLVRPER